MQKSPIAIALHFLKFRPRSIFEVEQKLKTKRISDKEIKRTIDILKRNGLLDDVKFAKMYVSDRNHFKPTGSYLLKLELKKLGLAEVIIDNTLKNQDEEELARQAIQMKSRYREAEFQKKAAFLQRRGFSVSLIYKVLKKEN